MAHDAINKRCPMHCKLLEPVTCETCSLEHTRCPECMYECVWIQERREWVRFISHKLLRVDVISVRKSEHGKSKTEAKATGRTL